AESRALSDRSARAQAACGLAALLANDVDLPRAGTLVEEALRELPDEPQFALERITCLLCAREVAEHRGTAAESLNLVQEAQRLLRHSPLGSEFHEFNVLFHLASSYTSVGRYSEASGAYQDAVTRLTALGRDDTGVAATLYNNWGMVLYQIGQPR